MAVEKTMFLNWVITILNCRSSVAWRRLGRPSFAQPTGVPCGHHFLAAFRHGDGSVQGGRRRRRGAALPDWRALLAGDHRSERRAGPHFWRLRRRPAAQGPLLQSDVLLRLLDRLDGERGQRFGCEISSVRRRRRAVRQC